MKTIVRKIDAINPQPDIVAEASEIILRGGLVAFPTETVYGLGANALDSAAVRRIFEAKDRPANNPVIVHAADVEGARRLALDWPENAMRLATHFWPGPLTMVLQKQGCVPFEITAGGPTVAVRVPSNPVALALIRAAGNPIAAPSANRSTEISPTRAEHVLHSLQGRIDMILDGGPAIGGIESTVVSLAGGIKVLRPGLITARQIEEAVGEPVAYQSPSIPDESTTLQSPGLMERHYAPRARLVLVPRGEGTKRTEEFREGGTKTGCLLVAGIMESTDMSVTLPDNPELYSAHLYDTLHTLDAMGAEIIVVELPPETETWIAVRDRLTRAASLE